MGEFTVPYLFILISESSDYLKEFFSFETFPHFYLKPFLLPYIVSSSAIISYKELLYIDI